jgi:hypothetical protein
MPDRRLEIHTVVAQYITLHEDGTYTMDSDALYETECPWPFYEQHSVYESEAAENYWTEDGFRDEWSSYDDVPADAWNELSLRIRAAFTQEAQKEGATQ